MIQLAVESAEEVYGAEHPLTQRMTYNLASDLRKLERYEESEIYYRICTEGLPRTSAAERKVLGNAIGGLGMVLSALGSHAEAEETLVEAIDIYREHYDPEAFETQLLWGELGWTLVGQERFAEAEVVLVDAAAQLAESTVVGVGNIVKAYERVIDMYERWQAIDPGGNYDERAEPWRERLSTLR